MEYHRKIKVIDMAEKAFDSISENVRDFYSIDFNKLKPNGFSIRCSLCDVHDFHHISCKLKILEEKLGMKSLPFKKEICHEYYSFV